MRQLLERPPSLRPRGLLIAGPYHNGKTMIAERFAVEHLRRADRQRVWVIQTREGAGLSHFYASILSGLRAPQAAGWRSLSRASEQVDHLLDSVKPRLLIFDEFHSCHCALINQILRIQGILGHFCTLNCNISTGSTLQDLTLLERLQIASARVRSAWRFASGPSSEMA